MTRPNYVSITLDALFPEERRTTRPPTQLFVYSVCNNPEGATPGTDAKLLGTFETYTEAADLMDAARATAEAIGVGSDAIGFCVVLS